MSFFLVVGGLPAFRTKASALRSGTHVGASVVRPDAVLTGIIEVANLQGVEVNSFW